MEYLIKDLSQMTGFSPARIRKWQERFNFLNPRLAGNGYWYYSNEDFHVLNTIKTLLNQGASLKKIVQMDREELLQQTFNSDISKIEKSFFKAISGSNFNYLKKFLKKKSNEDFQTWIHRLSDSLVLVGRGWEENHLSVADEHTFSNWFTLFLTDSLTQHISSSTPEYLVVSFPGDEHTLGAMLFYTKLVYENKSTRFCGMLPEKELIRELTSGKYKTMYVSITMPKEKKLILSFENRIKKRFPNLKIRFGGFGYEKRK